MPLHVQDLPRHCPFEEVLRIFVGTRTLQFQGLELGQEVVNPLAGALMKMQELGPCPLLIISWEKGLDLRLQRGPGWPRIGRHTLIEANLSEAACTRAFQARVYSRHLLLIGGGGMGGGNPNLNFGPPLMELLGRPVIGLRGGNNFLCRNGTCGSGGNIGLVGEELGESLPEVLLVLDELLNGSFPIHC